MSITAVGIDLAAVLTEAINRHQSRKCAFREGAAERLIASPEFAALAALIETEETQCAARQAEAA